MSLPINSESVAFKTFQLNVSYEKHPVLWDISLEIPKNTITAVIGPNGAGKSTLIKTALGLVKSSCGSVLFFNKPLSKAARQIAYVPQRESVDWDFPITVIDLVLMGAYKKIGLFKFVSKKYVKEAEEILSRLGMLAYKNRQISQLSGGQQQRVFIARALMQKADLYFFDEPFAGIDFATSKLIYELFCNLKKEGKTLIVVHHDLSTVKQYFDYVVMLNMSLVAAGPVSSHFTKEMVAKAFGQTHELFEELSILNHDKNSGLSDE